VRVWDAESGACVATFKGKSGDVTSVAFSPDGRNIASGSLGGKIKIWDVSNLLEQNGGKKDIIKKKKLIDTYKKSELVKISKKHEVSLKTRNDKVKTKLQLFNSLKRKGLL
jgi:WD40 repeat protein